MIKRFPLLLLCIYCFSLLNTAIAQNKDYIFSQYNQEQGLISSTITSIQKDKIGYLWLFSENGICRFDGYKFKPIQNKNIQEAQNSIRIKAVASNHNGNVFLFSSQNQVGKVLAGASSFSTICTFSKSGSNSYFIDNEEFFILHNTSEKTLYIFSLEGNLLKKINISNWANTKIFRTSHQHYLLVEQNNSLLLFDFLQGKYHTLMVLEKMPQTFEVRLTAHPYSDFKSCISLQNDLYELDWQKKVISRSSIPSIIQKSILHSPLILKTPNAFYSFKENQLLVYKNSKFYLKDLNKDIPQQNPIIGLFNGIQDEIYLVGKENSFYCFNTETKQISKVSSPPFTNARSVLDNLEAFYAENEVAWLASPGNGLIKMEARTSVFTPYSDFNLEQQSNNSDEFYRQNIRSICEFDESRILLGSLKGLLVYNTRTRKISPASKEIPSCKQLDKIPISNIIRDKNGDICISSWNELGLFLLNKKNELKLILGSANADLIKGTIRNFYFDKTNTIWLGTPDNKIYTCNWDILKEGTQLAKNIHEISSARNNSPNLGIVFAFLQIDADHLFIACENGLMDYHYRTNNITKRIIKSKDGKEVTNIRSMLLDQKNLIWLGTNGMGLIRYNFKNKQFKQWTTDDGLGDNYIYSIQFGKSDEIWMGTNNGLSSFNQRMNEFHKFSSIDGLQSAEFNTNASLLCSNKMLIFGGIAGFNYFSPWNLTLPEINNTVQLISIWNNGQEITPLNNEIQLKYIDNNLKIEFAGLGHFRNNEYQYAYEMQGLTNGWINCETQREISFLKIPPGRYTFRVKVSDCFGRWHLINQAIHIKVETPWYRTWWFVLLSASLILLITAIIIREKLNQIERLQHIRNNIAKDLHDEVGANLSNITLFIALLKQKVAVEESETRRLIDKINLFSQASQESMSDIVWMINAKNDQFSNLAIKMKDYATSLNEDLPIKISFSIDPALDKIKMSMVYKKNIYLIFKEAFNNAIKYANASEITITAQLTHKKLELSIYDNGIGFDESLIKAGNGLLNLKKRAEQLNGKLFIEKGPQKGTIVRLICPIN